ncbi:MAG: hypothetical protein IJM49_00670 [Firmicutes bacterium]|nr:hypothetical protein [Bacillota bacterium]MBR0481119.1 hypothetical protein [Bacillota bacterium]
MKKTQQIQIYVGLNDSETHEQKFDTEKYISILKNVCKNYGVAFSLNTLSGGYIHDDGTYVEETTLVITLIGAEGNTVEEIATDLCVFFNQESVMVTSTPSEVFFVNDKAKA